MTRTVLGWSCLFLLSGLISCKTPSTAKVKADETSSGEVTVDTDWAGSMQTSLANTKSAMENLNTAAESLVDASETAEYVTRVVAFNEQLSGIGRDLNAALTSMIVKLNATPYSGPAPYARVVASEFAERSAKLSNMANVQVPQLYNFSAKYTVLAQANAPVGERRAAEKALFRAIDDLTIEIQANLQVIEGWIAAAQPGGGSGGGGGTPAVRRERYVLEGFYVTGDLPESQNSGQASASWQTVCDQSIEKLRTVLDQTGVGRQNIETFDCGTMQNISRYSNIGYYLFGSTATATVVMEGNIATQKGLTITGEEFEQKDKAYKSWREKCFNMASTLRERYPNAVAATCGTPKNVSSYANINYFRLQSPSTVWLRFPDGSAPSQDFGDLFAVGPEFERNETRARDEFNSSCNDVRQTYQTLLGDRLTKFECGEPRNGSSYANINYISYFANPTATVNMPQNAVTQNGSVIEGDEAEKKIYEPWKSWWGKCKTALNQAKAQWGTRFAFATCGVPTNMSSYSNIGYVKYRSTMKVWLTPL